MTAQVVQDFGRQSAPITGTAYDFVADQGHIFVPDSTDFGVWTNYTVSAWINPDNIANDHKGIVGNHNGNGFIFALQNNDNNSLEFWTNSVWAQNGPSIAEDGTWKHVVFACNNGSAYFYLDGVATSASCIPTADGGDIYI